MRRTIFGIGLVLFGLLGARSASEATPNSEVVVISAEADAFVASGIANLNQDGDSRLRVGYQSGFETMYIYLKFDMDAVPDGAVVESVDLTLFLDGSSPSDDAPLSIDAYQVTSGWAEQIVTWSNRPSNDTDVLDSAAVFRSGGGPSDTYTWTITDMANAWISGSSDNHGVVLIANANALNPRSRSFYTRGETGTLFRPRLQVTYQEDTIAPTSDMVDLAQNGPLTFDVSWTGSDSSGIASYDVQIQVNGGIWIDWISGTTSTTAPFTGFKGDTYGFRVRARDAAGNVEAYPDQAETEITVGLPYADFVSPANYQLFSVTTIPMSWTGDANGTGTVVNFKLNTSVNGGPYSQQIVTGNATTYNATEDGIYRFEISGCNGSGECEPLREKAELTVIVDAVAPFISTRAFLPIVQAP